MDRNWLLVSDLDGTLLGDDSALSRFAAWYEEMDRCVVLAYASGRLTEDIFDLVTRTELPAPQFVIGGVGSEIARFSSRQPVHDWPPSPPAPFNGERIRQLLGDIPDLDTQPAHLQSAQKVSFYLREADASRLQHIGQRLEKSSIDAELIYSHALHLDVLPQGVNKGRAASFLAERLGIPDRNVVVCGDSGNDLSLFQQGFSGVVVGNAAPELQQGATGNAYFATAGFADGVLEGILHYIGESVPA